MRAKTSYAHFHERSSRWFCDEFLSFSTDPERKRREAHHHRIVDQRTGMVGEGFGFSYHQAEAKAWDDLTARRRSRQR